MAPLTFRELQYDDLPFLNRVRNEAASEFLHDSRTFPLEQTQQWFKTLTIPYYLVLRNDIPVGYFRLAKNEKGRMLIGMDIAEEFRNQGLGYDAYTQFLPQVFDLFNTDRLYLEVLETNARAIHLYKKLGFEELPEESRRVKKNDASVLSIYMMKKKESLS
jgi:RimJ/RimL family protein N-acetyltransferase